MVHYRATNSALHDCRKCALRWPHCALTAAVSLAMCQQQLKLFYTTVPLYTTQCAFDRSDIFLCSFHFFSLHCFTYLELFVPMILILTKLAAQRLTSLFRRDLQPALYWEKFIFRRVCIFPANSNAGVAYFVVTDVALLSRIRVAEHRRRRSE